MYVKPKFKTHNVTLNIPEHLNTYIVDQNYDKYTAENQQTWCLIMKTLQSFLSVHAHSLYIKGIKDTGITLNAIPRISDIDKKLQTIGWRAVPVSGFIPPAIFMEFQLHNIIPIASEMRTKKHINYTPAPDIVHEAAGHTPFLIDPTYRNFLKKYALIIKKTIFHKQDFKQYSAIRHLSEIKENPNSLLPEIKKAEENLNQINKELTTPSEASLLSRFIWWTAEYGLIGDFKNPKIYGAGLLSSIGESKICLTSKVKKIGLDISCLDYSYDITNYQPQLFITPSFEFLHSVLEDVKKLCAFYRGGEYGLKKAYQAQTICTIELDSGLQISGVLEHYIPQNQDIVFLKLKGACQLSYADKQLKNHGVIQHKTGYSSPLGLLKNSNKPLYKMDTLELQNYCLIKSGYTTMEFASGCILKGQLLKEVRKDGKLLILQFKNCHIYKGSNIYYKPEWGIFDLAIGQKICSVFGGPADRVSYGNIDTFKVSYS